MVVPGVAFSVQGAPLRPCLLLLPRPSPAHASTLPVRRSLPHGGQPVEEGREGKDIIVVCVW